MLSIPVQVEATIKIGSKMVLCLAYCPDLNSIIAGGEENYIKVCRSIALLLVVDAGYYLIIR